MSQDRFSILTASESDLIHHIISLSAELGVERDEDGFRGTDKEVLIRILVQLELESAGNPISSFETLSLGNSNVPNEICPSNTAKTWNGRKVLAFHGRTQKDNNETQGEYLEVLKRLANEAGITDCHKCSERQIVGRFLSGINESDLKDRLLTMNSVPRVVNLEDLCKSPFDLIMRSNVEHIWESIFLSLDCESFRACLQVSQAWSKILQKMLDSTYSVNMWTDPDNLENRMWTSNKEICHWTVADEEVAYAERRLSSMIVSFISKTGSSLEVKLAQKHGKVQKLWILRHIVLVRTELMVCAIDKYEMNITELFSVGMSWNAHHNPYVGVRFVAFRGTKSRAQILMREVSVDHFRREEWSDEWPDKTGCCFAGNAVPGNRQSYIFEGVNHGIFGHTIDFTFSEGWSYLLCSSYDIGTIEGGLDVFSIEKDDGEMKIHWLWYDDLEKPTFIFANSQRLVYGVEDTEELAFRDIKDGSKVKSIKLAPNHDEEVETGSDDEVEDGDDDDVDDDDENQWLSADDESDDEYDDDPVWIPPKDDRSDKETFVEFTRALFTGRRLFLFYSYEVEDENEKSALLIVDLETDNTRTSFWVGKDWEEQYWEDWAPTLNRSKNGLCLTHFAYDNAIKWCLLDLSSSNTEKVLNSRKFLVPKNPMNGNADTKWVKNLWEVAQGLCLLEVQVMDQDHYGRWREVEMFAIESIGWKKEALPKAIEVWFELISCTEK